MQQSSRKILRTAETQLGTEGLKSYFEMHAPSSAAGAGAAEPEPLQEGLNYRTNEDGVRYLVRVAPDGSEEPVLRADGVTPVLVPPDSDRDKFDAIMKDALKKYKVDHDLPIFWDPETEEEHKQLRRFKYRFSEPLAQLEDEIGEIFKDSNQVIAMMMMFVYKIDPKYYDYFAIVSHHDAAGPEAMTAYFEGGRKQKRSKRPRTRRSKHKTMSRSGSTKSRKRRFKSKSTAKNRKKFMRRPAKSIRAQ